MEEANRKATPAEAAGIAHASGALLLCYAIQAVGKMQVDMAALGAVYLSLSAHKMGGPHRMPNRADTAP